MSYGPPFVRHDRASDAKRNRAYEVEGKHWNEDFWQIFDGELSKTDLAGAVDRDLVLRRVCDSLTQIDNLWAKQEGEAMALWRGLFT